MPAPALSKLTAAIKITLFLLVSILFIPIQGLGTLFLPKGKLFHTIAHAYYGLSCLIFGIHVRQMGAPLSRSHTVFVGNHLSYIDICSIGAIIPATFISKAEIKTWPVFGLLATTAQTIFISRTPADAPKAMDEIKKRLKDGRSLILFPEGTSSSGQSVLPFKSSVFQIFLEDNIKENLVIQPFTLRLDRLDGDQVITEDNRTIYAWYGNMEFLPHLWRLAQAERMGLSLVFHPPRPARAYEDRKQFAKDCEADVTKGLLQA